MPSRTSSAPRPDSRPPTTCAPPPDEAHAPRQHSAPPCTRRPAGRRVETRCGGDTSLHSVMTRTNFSPRCCSPPAASMSDVPSTLGSLAAPAAPRAGNRRGQAKERGGDRVRTSALAFRVVSHVLPCHHLDRRGSGGLAGVSFRPRGRLGGSLCLRLCHGNPHLCGSSCRLRLCFGLGLRGCFRLRPCCRGSRGCGLLCVGGFRGGRSCFHLLGLCGDCNPLLHCC